MLTIEDRNKMGSDFWDTLYKVKPTWIGTFEDQRVIIVYLLFTSFKLYGVTFKILNNAVP